MASLKFVAMAALLVGIIFSAFLYINLNYIVPATTIQPAGEPTDEVKPSTDYVYTGPLQVFTRFFAVANTSACTASADLPDSYIYHMDGTLFGSETGSTGSVSGELVANDNGQLKLVLDTMTTTTVWVVDTNTAMSPYVVSGSQSYWDHDADGFLEACWLLEFDNFGPLAGGQTDKDAYLNLYCSMADNAVAITSLINSTGVSTSSYSDYTDEAYISSFTGEGYAIKIVKIELDVWNWTSAPAAEYGTTAGTNETYVDNGQVAFKSLTLGYGLNKEYTFTNANYESSTARWTVAIGVDDISEPAKGLIVHYDKNAGSTFAKIKLTLQAGAFSAGESFVVQVRMYYIRPDGVQNTVQTGYMSFGV